MEELVKLIYVQGDNMQTVVRMFIVFIAILVIHSVIKYLGKLS